MTEVAFLFPPGFASVHRKVKFRSHAEQTASLMLLLFSPRSRFKMPESPLSPAAARQTPASSLLSHTDSGAGDGGDSCSGVSGNNWPSLHHKQVPSSSRRPPTQPSSFICSSSYAWKKKKKGTVRRTSGEIHLAGSILDVL